MIAAIVVLYNPDTVAINSIRSYYESVDKVIMLDNSPENNFREVNALIGIDGEHIIYHHFGKNIGLCAAMNYGMDIAKRMGCGWALLLDDDSALLSDIVSVYQAYLTGSRAIHNVAVLAPVHIFDRNKAVPFKGVKSVSWAMTSGCFYNIAIFEELGGFLDELFVDCLDMDYCFKAAEAGYRVIECGEAVLQHHPAETRKINFFGIDIVKYGYALPWRYCIQCKGLIWIFLRYRKFSAFSFYLWKWVKVIFLFDNKKEYIRQMAEGTKEGLDLYRNYRRSWRL